MGVSSKTIALSKPKKLAFKQGRQNSTHYGSQEDNVAHGGGRTTNTINPMHSASSPINFDFPTQHVGSAATASE